ncbi:MAG: hypothetical protein IJO78_03715 [Erysipelotrichaceae bacterium]|nr:hypothetical protein [Erysipelotrichaceae bacterium]
MLVIKNVERLLQQDDYYQIIKDFKRLWLIREKYNNQTISNRKVQKEYTNILQRYEEILNLYKYHMIHLHSVEEKDPYVDRAMRHLLMGLSNIIPEEFYQ